MKAIFYLLSILLSHPAFSQQAILKGRISDQNAPNDTAFTVYFKRDGKIVDSTSCRKAGYFEKSLKAGKYDIVISKALFPSQTLKSVTLNPSQNEINFSLKFMGIAIKEQQYLYTAELKKTGLRSSTDIASHAAGTTSTRKGISGRGSRAEASADYEDGVIVSGEHADKDKSPNRPGQVTAGHWRDLDHWKDWLKTNNSEDVAAHMKTWGLYPKTLNMVQVMNQTGEVLPFVSIQLLDGTKVVWESVTDTEGKAYLWPMVDKDSVMLNAKDLKLKYEGQTYNVPNYSYNYPDKIIRISTKLKTSSRIEIGFMVDATGSMGDEIKFLQRELIDVISRIKKERPCSDIYTGSVFYKDHGDDYVTRVQPMTSNPVNTIDFISHQYASGGGDFPEAVDDGLEASIKELNWTESAGTKILFILLDAPPHVDPKIQKRLNAAIQLASARGIRLIPVAASGINQQTEFLLKYMAIISNGEYLYITDDSRIGGSHILPTGGKSDVEFLNDLMVKTIVAYSVNACPEEQQQQQVNTERDSTLLREQKKPLQNEFVLGDNWHMRFYPNPATEVVYFEFSEEIERIRISNLSGQLIYERNDLSEKSHQVELSQFSSGIYSVQVVRKGELLSGKLVVIH